jgi:drug/metabolite transporter (DMT)-like permease
MELRIETAGILYSICLNENATRPKARFATPITQTGLMTQPPEITPRSWAMVATLGIVWGATFMFISMALEGITPFWLAAGRVSFATLLTLLVWWAAGGKLFLSDQRPWGVLVVIGILSSGLPFLLLSWAQQHVASGYAGVSMASVALMVLPLSHMFVPGERMTLRRTLGFVIGFVGVCMLVGSQAFQSSGSPLETWGRLACLGAACCYAVSSVTMRRLPPVDPIGLAAVPLLFGCLFVLPLAWLKEGPPVMPDGNTLIVLLVLALIPTAGANLLRVLVIRSAGPVFMSLTNYQVPLWSVIFGVLFLGEPFQISLIFAMALILIGLAISQYGALKRLFSGKK